MSKGRSGYVCPVQLLTIINVPHVAPLADMSVPLGSAARSESTVGAVSTKMRYLIVLIKLLQHMIVIPLYTHSGRGIGHKPEEVHSELMSLKLDTAPIEECDNHTPYPPLDIRYGPFRSTYNVHLMAPCVISYGKANCVAGSHCEIC
ncbi:hypothetical protein BU16DRAFT_530695 [Lophium mytilinum]|uniref:Uncharacterized protein n=1 Tax=Lophium mytilinum TaxID=390894 RepID=A0A6A6QFF7_9PEZI|nr:hypothetical protein BU16DRAFT_530695 [Lophium mytilinum]